MLRPETDEGAQKPNLYRREGDQALPVPNAETSCQQRFMDWVNELAPVRMELGLARYGTLLQPFNGRDFMQDAEEELFDLSVYMQGIRAEREAMLDLLGDVAAIGGPDAELTMEQVAHEARVLLLSMGRSITVAVTDEPLVGLE